MNKSTVEQIETWRRSPGYCSNAYMLPRQIAHLISRCDVESYYYPAAVLVVEDCESYNRLYFFSENSNTLYNAVSDCIELSDVGSDLVVDVLVTNGDEGIVCDAFKELGFTQIGLLSRMNINPSALPAVKLDEGLTVTTPDLDDASEIAAMLEASFDMRVSRLPNESEIKHYIEQGGVRVANNGEELVGVAVFKDMVSRRPCLDQLLVSPQFRGRGLATRLIAAVVDGLGASDRPYLWAVDSALSYYENIGCVSDGLVDYVLAYER